MKEPSIEQSRQTAIASINDRNESVGQQNSQTAIAGDVKTSGGNFTGRDQVSIQVGTINIYQQPMLPVAQAPCPLAGYVVVMCGLCGVMKRYSPEEQ